MTANSSFPKKNFASVLGAIAILSSILLIGIPSIRNEKAKDTQFISCGQASDIKSFRSRFRTAHVTNYLPVSGVTSILSVSAQANSTVYLVLHQTTSPSVICALDFSKKPFLEVPIEDFSQEPPQLVEILSNQKAKVSAEISYQPSNGSGDELRILSSAATSFDPIHTQPLQRLSVATRFFQGLPAAISSEGAYLKLINSQGNHAQVGITSLGIDSAARTVTLSSDTYSDKISSDSFPIAISATDSESAFAAQLTYSFANSNLPPVSLEPTAQLRGRSFLPVSPSNQRNGPRSRFLQIYNLSDQTEKFQIRGYDEKGNQVPLSAKQCSFSLSAAASANIPAFETLLCEISDDSRKGPALRMLDMTSSSYLAQMVTVLPAVKGKPGAVFIEPAFTQKRAKSPLQFNFNPFRKQTHAVHIHNPSETLSQIEITEIQNHGQRLTSKVTLEAHGTITRLFDQRFAGVIVPPGVPVVAAPEGNPSRRISSVPVTLENAKEPPTSVPTNGAPQAAIEMPVIVQPGNGSLMPRRFKFICSSAGAASFTYQLKHKEVRGGLATILNGSVRQCSQILSIPSQFLGATRNEFSLIVRAISPDGKPGRFARANFFVAGSDLPPSPTSTPAASATSGTGQQKPEATPPKKASSTPTSVRGSATNTPAPAATKTFTPTPTVPATVTPKKTNTPIFTATATSTATATMTATSTATLSDNCPTDPIKTEPGICGCGISDKDSDGDGTADCKDACPSDINKIVLGQCGCGKADTDSDGDGTADCNDGCSTDSEKTAAGICGCGKKDSDSDSDGTADCKDGCPADPLKNTAGVCGCGIADKDSDNDRTPDCRDQCPQDPAKIAAGQCGCGVSEGTCTLDSDGDSIVDVNPGEQKDDDNDGIKSALEANNVDSDGDGKNNNADDDDDGDGILTKLECSDERACADRDQDGLPDYLEHNLKDTDGDGKYDWDDADDDGDGDSTKTELGCVYPRLSFRDSDDDQIPDYLDPKGNPEDCDDDGKKDKLEYLITCNESNRDQCGKSFDSDKDKIPDFNDACDQDNLKFRPGKCGCGVAETDTDKDGIPDCQDTCPSDKEKIQPGICGCGTPDTDTDGDGTPDCRDECKADKAKTSPGVCGCGKPDTDTDGDGTPDCRDLCAQDKNKVSPGTCGCGVADVDSDGDGTPDCRDACPSDPAKIVAGSCGCGAADTDSDGDGTPNCRDQCATDPLKTLPLTCGCNVAETDSDGDGKKDCQDGCPSDRAKIAPGTCGCGVPETDTDNDSVPDCADQCPRDNTKTAPGKCGCGAAEGTCDKEDLCKDDPNKESPGVCGCGKPDVDDNKNGVIDCDELEGDSGLQSQNISVFDKEGALMSGIKATRVVHESLKETAESINQLLANLGVPNPAIIKQDPKLYVIKKGTKYSAFINYDRIADAACVVNPFFDNLITNDVKAEAQRRKDSTLPVGIASATTPRDIPAGELQQLLAGQSCRVVSGLTDHVEDTSDGLVVSGTFNDPEYGSQKYLEAIKFEKAYNYFKDNAKRDVVVAFIDTGFDFRTNTDLTQFHDILEGSNMVEGFESTGGNPNLPQDDLGHGTSVASLVSAPENNGKKFVGIGGARIKVLPIRIMRGGSTGADGSRRVVEGIRLAVNAGAKIVNLSLGEMNKYFCNPVIGEAVFRGIEKGVTFFFAAGNGYIDRNGVPVPIELKGPTDHGPQQFGKTMSPACWGSYFKGAMTVASVDTGTNNISLFSNFGDVAEMSAPGSDILSQGLNGTSVSASGTSFSSPIAAAAAALIYSEFKTKNRYISPWLLEDLLLNGSPSVDSLATLIHRGKTIDLEYLKNYLTSLSSFTEEQLRRIPSENRSVGKGWDPEKDIERIAKILVTAERKEISAGESLQLRAQVLYTDGTLRDVTNDPKIFWTAQYQPQKKTSIGPKTGAFSLRSDSSFPEKTPIEIIAHYDTDYEGSTVLQVVPWGRKLVLQEISIGGDPSVRWGDLGRYEVIGKYVIENTSTEVYRDLTGVAQVTSSSPSEMELISEYRGGFRTVNCFGGREYTLSASYEGKTAQRKVTVTKRLMSLQVRNTLGDPFKGQPVTLRAVLGHESLVDDLPVLAQWKSLSPGLTVNRNGFSETTILTRDLTLGSYTVEASTVYRGMGEDTVLKKSYTFKVVDTFARLELLTKTPIINFQNRAVFSLRFYTDNNSFVVINPAEINWTTSDPALPIDNQGIVYPTQASLKDGKRTRYRVEAQYLGTRVGADIEIVNVSELSGMATALSHLTIVATWDRKLRCSTDVRKAGCEKIVMSGADASFINHTYKVYANYSDGQKRDVTRFASWSSSHPNKLSLSSGYEYTATLMPTSNPSDIYTVTSLYEGFKAQVNVSVIPLVDAQFVQSTADGKRLKFPSGGLYEFTDVYDRSVEGEYKLIDARGYESVVPFSLSGYRWTSSDPAVAQVTQNLNVELADVGNRWFYFVSKNMSPDREYEIKYEKNYLGYGFSKPISGTLRAKVIRSRPVGHVIRISSMATQVGNSTSTPHVISEKGSLLTCQLTYSTGEGRYEPCENSDLTFTRVDTGQPAEDIAFSTNRSGASQYFLNWGSKNLDKRIRISSTHRATGFSASDELYVVGIENFDHQLAKKPFPAENPTLKPDDSYCTPERRATPLSPGGIGSAEDPIKICSPVQFKDIGKAVARARTQSQGRVRPFHVAIMANLDFTSIPSMRPINLYADSVDPRDMVLNGNNYRISNYTIIDREADDIGLFEQVQQVKDLILVNPVLRGGYRVGALAGRSNGELSNIRVLGGTIWGAQQVGGLVGSLSMGPIDQILILGTQVFFEGAEAGGVVGTTSAKLSNLLVKGVVIRPAGVQGAQSKIGGIAGSAAGGSLPGPEVKVPSEPWLKTPSGYIFNANFSGTIDAGLSASGAVLGSSSVGGLVGEGSMPIIASEVKADLTAAGSGIGGLVGSAKGCSRYSLECLIYDSAFEGSITGGQNIDRVSSAGGLVGYGEGGMIFKSRVKGTIRGREGVGGAIGSGISLYRFHQNSVEGLVSSSTESHGGFFGTLANTRYRDYPAFQPENIYIGNTWKNAPSQNPVADIGLWKKPTGDFRNVDVDGIN